MQAETFSQCVITIGHVQKKVKKVSGSFVAKLTIFRFYQAKIELLYIGKN